MRYKPAIYQNELALFTGRGRCTSPSRKEKMRRERPSGRDGKVRVIQVSARRMEEIWK